MLFTSQLFVIGSLTINMVRPAKWYPVFGF